MVLRRIHPCGGDVGIGQQIGRGIKTSRPAPLKRRTQPVRLCPASLLRCKLRRPNLRRPAFCRVWEPVMPEV